MMEVPDKEGQEHTMHIQARARYPDEIGKKDAVGCKGGKLLDLALSNAIEEICQVYKTEELIENHQADSPRGSFAADDMGRKEQEEHGEIAEETRGFMCEELLKECNKQLVQDQTDTKHALVLLNSLESVPTKKGLKVQILESKRKYIHF
eukprot:TRINITY_DN2413_c0_g1_i1.p2 TRINITY_DN2413_c0_g1~~TRINITY_DN2413_c0_g1_i1.p2  ORF type:complete len:150 (-),score=10.86 TRINITY_DN2413_c0_g1_i1:91-540(-)